MTMRSYFNHQRALAFSPNGRRLAVSGSSPNTAIKLWDPATQTELITLEIDIRANRPSIFTILSPDGNTLTSASANGPMHLWRAPSFEEIEAKERKGSPR